MALSHCSQRLRGLAPRALRRSGQRLPVSPAPDKGARDTTVFAWRKRQAVRGLGDVRRCGDRGTPPALSTPVIFQRLEP